MQDKEIRRILIEYLKIQHEKYRIYQEKSIGSSICDLMLVTDRLTGFEIKSDSDNYERLERQINAYNQFFDENYICIGSSHVRMIESKIPNEWGILCVEPENIRLLRPAKKCKSVDRQKQLSILWKLELKNILVKNHLPIYAQKGKPFLIQAIAESVPNDVLGRQITEELLSRDYSVFDAKDYTIKSQDNNSQDVLFETTLPETELVDRLSEEDLSEFTLDKWMAIYKKAVEQRTLKRDIEIAKDKERSERSEKIHTIPYTDIEVSLGVPWVSAEIISQFAKDVLKADQRYYYDYDESTGKYSICKKLPLVQYESITGYWYVDKLKGYTTPELVRIYGTERFNAMQILECTLNLREIKIYNGTKYSEVDTLAAVEKQKKIKEAFKEWIWLDEDRRWIVEEAYNNLFAEYAPKTYSDENIGFVGMNPNITLFDYQRDAVKRIISTNNTLLSFDVGTGKTYIMIAAAMEMRKSGLSRKNLFVVPNNIVGQWEQMFSTLYPKAKVLAVDPRSFTQEKRNKILTQIQKEDYDGIIMAYSCFEMIPLSKDYLLKNMANTLSVFDSHIQHLRGSFFPNAKTHINREADYVKKTINELIDCCCNSSVDICFDELDISTLFVDEAHNFKNIPIRSSLRNLRGVNTTGSNKCLEMLKKVQYVQENNGGRGVVFATGTPLCNSISDAYAMQCYLQFDELKKKGLDRFDNWVKTFAHPEEVCEIDVNAAGFRIVNRFTRFFNLPELSKMFGEVSIFYNGNNNGVPDLHGYTDVVINGSSELNAYMKRLFERTETIRNGDVDRKKDNMLKVSTDGRKAALSLRLVGEEQAYDENNKIYNCVSNVCAVYHKYNGCSQLIFCDYSTPNGMSYNVYKEVKQRLIERGIPKKEIAFVHSCKNEEQKLRLYDDVNAGRVRILLGSTFKLGIGANVQSKLKAVHHLDVPWRPADMVQREGRILRQGNENDEVFIYRYIVEGSFDSYSWQILQTKQHFIAQFLSGSNTVRSIEDLECTELNYAQVKALALSEPLMKEYVEKENELRTARAVLRQEQMQTESTRKEIQQNEDRIAFLKDQLEKSKDNASYVGTNYKNVGDCISYAAELVNAKLKLAQGGEVIAKIGEFEILAPLQKTTKPFAYISRNGVKYYIEFSESLSGNKTRLNNFFSKFDNQLKNISKAIGDLEEKNKGLKKLLTIKPETASKIKMIEAELSDIFSRLSVEKQI